MMDLVAVLLVLAVDAVSGSQGFQGSGSISAADSLKKTITDIKGNVDIPADRRQHYIKGEFIANNFGTLKALIQNDLTIPRFKQTFVSRSTECLCTSQGTIKFRLGGIMTNLQFRPTTGGYSETTFRVSLKATKDLTFKTTASSTASACSNDCKFCEITPQTDMKIKFKENGLVDFLLQVSEFPEEVENVNLPRCLVTITSIKIARLQLDRFEPNDPIPSRIWGSLEGYDLHKMIIFGIVDALVNGKVKPVQLTEWACIHDDVFDFHTAAKQNANLEGSVTYVKKTYVDVMTHVKTNILNLESRIRTTGRTSVATSNDVSLINPSEFIEIRRLFDPSGSDNYYTNFCQANLNSISNSGKSKSELYISNNNEFVVKTLDSDEAKMLSIILEQYKSRIQTATLLVKFYGLYKYKDLNYVVMNNLMKADPTKYTEKLDLKGSFHDRYASPEELLKKSPTFKDVDFVENLHPHGIYLKKTFYDELMKKINDDAEMLRDLIIVDYSLLLIIEYEATKAQVEAKRRQDPPSDPPCYESDAKGIMFDAYGQKVKLHMGIIDVLQKYNIWKQAEVAFKSFYIRNKSFSVAEPAFYADRFITHMKDTVFHAMEDCRGRSVPVSDTLRTKLGS